MTTDPKPSAAQQIGDYVLFEALGVGGMASVHLGRARARGGFARAVAIKKMHPHVASDPELVSMFLDEARIASRIRHPNVVSTLDLCRTDTDVLIVMDVVVGESLSTLLRTVADRGEPVPVDVAVAIGLDMLAGLHAAHEATDERGASLGVIHRDVSPHNVLVGIDGVARVVDFGIAQAASRTVHTRTGQLRGKLAYMAPERIAGLAADRRVDIYAASVVLWETFAGRRLFEGDEAEIVGRIAIADVPLLSTLRNDVPPGLDEVIAAGMARKLEARHPTAASLANALASIAPRATSARVGAWVSHLAQQSLRERQQRVVDIETGSLILEKAPRSQLSPRARRRVAGGVAVGVLVGAGLIGGVQWWRTRSATDDATSEARGSAAPGGASSTTAPPKADLASQPTTPDMTMEPARSVSATAAEVTSAMTSASPSATARVVFSARPSATPLPSNPRKMPAPDAGVFPDDF